MLIHHPFETLLDDYRDVPLFSLCVELFLDPCHACERSSGCAKRWEDSFCLRSLRWQFFLIFFLIKIIFKCWLCVIIMENYQLMYHCFWCPFLGMCVRMIERALTHLSNEESFCGLNYYPNGLSLVDSLSIWIMEYMAKFHANLESEEMQIASLSRQACVRKNYSTYHILKSPSVWRLLDIWLLDVCPRCQIGWHIPI